MRLCENSDTNDMIRASGISEGRKSRSHREPLSCCHVLYCYDRTSVGERLEQSVSILLTTLNYKTLRKERKRRNSRHQKVSKTAKTSFPFLLPNSQTDDHLNSEPIRDSADIRNTATVISAIWVSTVTCTHHPVIHEPPRHR